MELLRQKSRATEPTETVTELHDFTWRQVIAEIEIANHAYRHDGGKIRNMFQKMCDSAPIFENWLCLLPDGDYGASISGAFVMLVRVSA